jgi:hypothetical protein
MTEYEEEFCGLKLHWGMGSKMSWDYVEERTIADLMELTDIDKFHSREAITEFLKRLFLIQNLPLSEIIDHHFNEGILFSVASGVHHFTLYSTQLDSLIGVSRKIVGHFDYKGRTEDYLGIFDRNKKELRAQFPSELSFKENLYITTAIEIRNAEIFASVLTDQLDKYKIENIESLKPTQYSRKALKTNYYDIYRKVSFNPIRAIHSEKLKTIKNLLREPFEYTDEYIHSSPTFEEWSNAVIQVAYGIKNGYINARASIHNQCEALDPYYQFDLDPIFEDLNYADSFYEVYNKWQVYEWMNLVPYED